MFLCISFQLLSLLFRQKLTTVMEEVIAMIVMVVMIAVVMIVVVMIVVVVEEEVAAEEEVVVDGTDADVVVLKERTLASTFKTRPPSHLCRRLMSVFWCFEEILSHCGCKRSTF